MIIEEHVFYVKNDTGAYIVSADKLADKIVDLGTPCEVKYWGLHKREEETITVSDAREIDRLSKIDPRANSEVR